MPELDLVEYDPLIDSSNVGPEDWAALAAQIRENYYDYDGFVIIHGTDTSAHHPGRRGQVSQDPSIPLLHSARSRLYRRIR